MYWVVVLAWLTYGGTAVAMRVANRRRANAFQLWVIRHRGAYSAVLTAVLAAVFLTASRSVWTVIPAVAAGAFAWWRISALSHRYEQP